MKMQYALFAKFKPYFHNICIIFLWVTNHIFKQHRYGIYFIYTVIGGNINFINSNR
ncbi:hypothetical protein HMPREF0663_12164 [Hoylesella oralis ATCC 33269]|uniref:Uncharacterized protein n=1 Tax=Hoylesella oralis ATCC 33269 TaxID=873533 RepID=E7RS96_9BACT|nr:hypothetical protein HMPREF0663_12164 [Hoylesella oralis ATCC 33269]